MNTLRFQIKSLLLIGLLLLSGWTYGQPMLGSDASPETVVFELNNKDALKLLKGKLGRKDWDRGESALETDSLVAGMPVTLTVTLQMKQEGAQYVMLEVPVPAGCSYASKPVNFSGSEVYREYFKEKTVIFSEKLPIGTYTFTIPLLPRFTGKYTLNPAKVELMYFPVVNANNEGKRIWITERKTKE